jgi:excisionase family DNA binding protein
MSPKDAEPAEGDVYLVARQVADMVKVSEPTVYRWRLDDPTMPALVVGKTVRFPRGRLMRWLKQREQGRAGR